MIQLAFPFLLILALVLSRARTTVITPLVVFVGVWAFMVAAYEMNPYFLALFNFAIPAKAHLARLISLLTFTGGFTLVWLVLPGLPAEPHPRLPGLGTITTCLLAALALCAALRLQVIYERFGAIISALPNVREEYVAGRLHFPGVTAAAAPLANLCALNLAVMMGLGQPAFGRTALLVVLLMINDAATADKSGMRLIVALGIGLYYTRRLVAGGGFRHVGRLLAGAAVALGLYSAITYFRVQGRTASVFDVTVLHFYGNIVGNLASSAWFMDHPWPPGNPGQYSFAGFYALLQRPMLNTADTSFYNADIMPVGLYNTTDYIGYLFADFGAPGLWLASLLLGAAGAVLFVRARSTRRPEVAQLLTLYTTGLVLSVRGFYYGGPGFWLTCGLVAAQAWVLRRLPVVTSMGRA